MRLLSITLRTLIVNSINSLTYFTGRRLQRTTGKFCNVVLHWNNAAKTPVEVLQVTVSRRSSQRSHLMNPNKALCSRACQASWLIDPTSCLEADSTQKTGTELEMLIGSFCPLGGRSPQQAKDHFMALSKWHSHYCCYSLIQCLCWSACSEPSTDHLCRGSPHGPAGSNLDMFSNIE